ncbi:MAG TPA: PIN domain-containing protein, partial [Polyangia bacterium]|nr:PIN domain-containing protein [Polyangia bacterium]
MGRRWAAARHPPATSFTIVPSFVDTNVLVYAEDRDAGRKHEIARDLIVDLWRSREGVLSVQVLQELYVTLTRKVRRPLPPARAAEVVREYLAWRIVDNDGDLLIAAMVLQQKGRISLWDALVVEAAGAAGCERLYSEDLNSGQRFGALKIVN